MNKELQKLLQQQRQNEDYHISIESEVRFYRAIANGDLEELNKTSINQEGVNRSRGKLSYNPVRDEKYHTIILIALITRFCIDKGLDSEEAYTLSDMFIRKLDETNDFSKILEIRQHAVLEFTNTMKNLQNKNIYSIHIKRAIDYISKNLTKPITSIDVGEAIGCNPDYLSKLFKKDLGLTLGDYILDRKCNTACYMLENSNESITDIALFLGFASTSHFIERFKKRMGVSPNKYRKEAKILS